MRTQLVNNTTIVYPEKIVWLNDSNIISLSSETHTVGAQITVTHPSGESKTIRHISDIHTLIFTLDDILLSLHDDNIGRYTILVELFENYERAGQLSFVLQVLNGKSYQDRSHGGSSVIYIYKPDELSDVQIYSPENGKATVGSTKYDIYEGVNSLDLSSIDNSVDICLTSESSKPITYITSATGISPFSAIVELDFEAGSGQVETGGDIWSTRTTFPVCKRLETVEHCSDFNFIELRYTDSDGCTRYLGGKVLEQTDNAAYSTYQRLTTDICKHVPMSRTNSLERTIKIGLTNIDKNAYAEDILTSEKVYFRNYQGSWKECTLKTDSISLKNDDFNDFEIQIITIM